MDRREPPARTWPYDDLFSLLDAFRPLLQRRPVNTLPDTLMGRFVLLNGILQHAWRTKRVLRENASVLSDPALQSYLRGKENAIHNSLRKWREGWPESRLDFEPLSESPSLYQDREACWYLAGIPILPHVTMGPPKTATSDAAGVMTVQQTFERLMLLSDQGLLHTVGQDFNATYRLVTEHFSSETSNSTLGALVYREADTTRAGFEE